MQLEVVERIDTGEQSASVFRDLLNRTRTGENTDEDYELLAQRSQCGSSMTREAWNERYGDNAPNVTRLYCTNKEVEEENKRRLVALGAKIALVEAKHTGKSRTMDPDKFRNLGRRMYIAVGAEVMATHNLLQPAGICNGSVGIVKEIIYKEDETAPSLPKCVWVDFGENYTGSVNFFPNNPERRGWVPIPPIKATCCTVSGNSNGLMESTRTMLPLRLAYAWTIWKAQGQTIRGYVVIYLSKKEVELGLTYVALSRDTRLA